MGSPGTPGSSIRLPLVISTWMFIALLKLTEDLLTSPFQSIFSPAARAILLKSQSIISEMNIILYVNYTSKKKNQITFLKTYQVASSLSQCKAEVITVESRSCMMLGPLWPQPPQLHQCTGLRAVPQVHWTPSHFGALGAIWNIQTPAWHSSTSHCYVNVTCLVRLPFLPSPIENGSFVPCHSIHLPALFLSLAPVPMSYTVSTVITYSVHGCIDALSAA